MRDSTNTLVYRSKVSDKGLDEEMGLFLVVLKFGVLNIKERKVHYPAELKTISTKKARGRQLVREVPPVQEAPRRVRDTGARASVKRTLIRGVEAAREGT